MLSQAACRSAGLSCFLSYANQYTKPFNEISGVITELQNALACAARIFELIEEEVEIPDDKDAVVLHQIEGKVKLEKGSVLLSAGAKTDRGSESGGGTGTDHCDCRSDRMRKNDTDQSADALL